MFLFTLFTLLDYNYKIFILKQHYIIKIILFYFIVINI